MNLVHGLSGTPVYKSWDSLKQRCFCVTHQDYPNYGARGIKVCDAILESPTAIVEIIGIRPSKLYSINRIDNNGHYSCGQCSECVQRGWKMNIEWATGKQQCRNRRSNRIVEVNGIKMTCSELCERTGLSKHTIYTRLKRGETGDALIAPIHERIPYQIVDQHNTFLPQ